MLAIFSALLQKLGAEVFATEKPCTMGEMHFLCWRHPAFKSFTASYIHASYIVLICLFHMTGFTKRTVKPTCFSQKSACVACFALVIPNYLMLTAFFKTPFFSVMQMTTNL